MSDAFSVFSPLPALFAAEPRLVRQAALARFALLLGAGDEECRLVLDRQSLRIEAANGPMDDWDVALRGDADCWSDHWRDVPPPSAADIFGMSRHGRMVIEGNFLPLMQHLQLIKDILALPRGRA